MDFVCLSLSKKFNCIDIQYLCVSCNCVCVCVCMCMHACMCIGVYYYCSWFIVGYLSFKNYKIRNTVLQVTDLKVSP
jgi:hypothetical protein